MARITAAVMLVALPLMLAGCGDGKNAQKDTPTRAVVTAKVHYEPLTPTRSFTATIRPQIESDLGFRVAGKVAQKLVIAGTRVAAGQPLATLDPNDFKLQKEQAEAELKASTAALAQAEADEDRAAALRKKGWVTEAVLGKQHAATEEARGRKSRAERALELASNALTYATLKSDVSGTVTLVNIEPGQVVAAGQVVVRVAQDGGREAVVAIPEVQLSRIREAKAEVSLWSNPGKIYPAKLRELSPSADAATRTYAARFTLEGAGPEVEFGMTANVTIKSSGHDQAARLPLSAMFNQGSGPALWVVKSDNSLELKPVEIISYDGREVLVKSGVNEGDVIVILGVQKLDAGQRVRVVQN